MSDLKNWCFVIINGELSLFGYVENHPKYEDGHRLVTSRICTIAPDMKLATTFSGTVYQLDTYKEPDNMDEFILYLSRIYPYVEAVTESQIEEKLIEYKVNYVQYTAL